MYAACGKKNGIASSGRSCCTACHNPCTPAVNVAPVAAGRSSVWGGAPGSVVDAVVGGTVVLTVVGTVVTAAALVVVGATAATTGAAARAGAGWRSSPRLTSTRPTTAATTRT